MAGGFDSLGLMPELLRAIDDLGWLLPTDVQDESIPLILGGGDIMAAAETGSGKTAAFSLPIIQCVHERLRGTVESTCNSISKSTSTLNVKLNENDKDAILNIGNYSLSCSSAAEKLWAGGRATHGAKAGKYYYEVIIQGTGICRVGWSTMSAHHELGKDAHGFGYGGTGMKSINGTFEAYGGKYGDGDVHAPSSDFSSLVHGDNAHVISANAKEAFVTAGQHRPLALILEPARDLAEQVYQNIGDMSRYVGAPEVKTALLVGGGTGEEDKRTKRAIEAGVDIVVGTLGKVCDMVKRKFLDLSQIRFFVLDEADRLTEPENMKEIMLLYNACPGGGSGDNRLQVCFFSATLHSPEITDLAGKICINPTWVDLKGVDSVPETVHHVIYRVDPVKDAQLLTSSRTKPITDGVHIQSSGGGEGMEAASEAIKQLKQQALLRVIDKFEMSQCMIFCRTNVDCDNLEAFKEGLVRFLICTDVAARGIDVQGLPFMINMTLPSEPEHYIHRIGRVGRAERMGLAISLVAGAGIEEKVWYHSSCPNRGKGCSNRKLTSEGGCTIWYNEPEQLEAVRQRLHLETFPELQEDFSLPTELASLGVVYGEDKKDQDSSSGAAGNAVSGLHVQLLRPTVLELGQMEVEAQNTFLRLQMQFGRR